MKRFDRETQEFLEAAFPLLVTLAHEAADKGYLSGDRQTIANEVGHFFVRFMSMVIVADRRLDQNEVDLFNLIMDADFSTDRVRKIVESEFNDGRTVEQKLAEVPRFLAALTELDRAEGSTLADSAVFTVTLLATVLAKADGEISEDEMRRLQWFADAMRGFVADQKATPAR